MTGRGERALPLEADMAIIGAGVVGLALAAEVAREGRRVLVLERNRRFGEETSSRNSQVIHAGIPYPPGSLKARLCVEGNALLYQLCWKFGLPYARLGKLIVAAEEKEVPALEDLHKRGQENGVEGLRLLAAEDLKKLEPHISGVAALLSPATGLLDVQALMDHFAGRAREGGAWLRYQTRVTGIERVPGGYRVLIAEPPGPSSFTCRVVVNAAGLDSDQVARLAGIDISAAGYELHFVKGEYFRVKGGNRGVKRLIYPLPAPAASSLGVHLTPTLDGGLLVGPNNRPGRDYQVDEGQRESFFQAARRFLPLLSREDLVPEMAGVRPSLNGLGFRDFIIREEGDRGLPGLINLIGIDSPGLTASPAIARYAGALVERALGG